MAASPVSAANENVEPSTWGEFLRTRIGVVVAGLLVIELMSAVQVFTTSTVLPTVAAELDGQSWYGVVIAAATVSALLTMPLGGRLLSTWGAAKVLGYLTPIYLLGAVTSAVAPTMLVFTSGRVLQGLASGAMATVALGTVAAAVSSNWRPRVLALTSAMWILPALIGPSYASTVTAWIGWRWSLLLLLPFLVGARIILAFLLEKDTGKSDKKKAPLPFVAAVGLACSIAVVTLASRPTLPLMVLGCVGAVGAMFAARRLLPVGSLVLRSGRPAAVGHLFLLSFVYFGINYVIAIVVSEMSEGSVVATGAVLTVGALSWAFASLLSQKLAGLLGWYKNSRPKLAGWFLLVGAGLILVSIALELAVWGGLTLVFGGWTLMGIGMGVYYPVLLDLVLAEGPDATPGEAANAAVLGETIAGALSGALAGTLLSLGLRSGLNSLPIVALFGGFVLVCALLLTTTRKLQVRTAGVD